MLFVRHVLGGSAAAAQEDVAVDLGGVLVGLGEPGMVLRPGVLGDLDLVDLAADHEVLDVVLERLRQALAVLKHVVGLVVGEDAEVEALEVALADAAEACRERRASAGKLGLEPLQAVLFLPIHRR